LRPGPNAARPNVGSQKQLFGNCVQKLALDVHWSAAGHWPLLGQALNVNGLLHPVTDKLKPQTLLSVHEAWHAVHF